VSVHLTEAGVKEWPKIVVATFQYIAMLQHEMKSNVPSLERAFLELKTMDEIMFRFKDEEQPFAYVTKLSGAMQNYPIDEVLCAAYLSEPSLADVQQILDILTPERLIIHLICKDNESQAVDREPHYGTLFSYSELPDTLLTELKAVEPISDLQ
jgi:secreted Zn-dependent insulinase-like peptidase